MTLTLRRAADSITLVDILQRRAERHPERQALAFLSDGETEDGTLSYSELDRGARAVAALLREHHSAGDRVLLLQPPSINFITTFIGCLYAGAVAVPSPAPMSSRALARIEAMIEDCKPGVVLTTREVMEKTEAARKDNPLLSTPSWVEVETAGHPESAPPPSVTPGDLAFLQYTSGSTSSPKGVMVTHGNVLANMRMIEEACGHGEDTSMLSWLPMYHDMGLIGCLLQPLYLGAQSVLMPPIRFIQKPIRWLQAITKYRPHTSGGPNFAYDLCVSRTTPEERAGLDLSSWRVAFNGAEPVRAGTLTAFAATFAEHGFRAETHYPNYGLAEGTLIVSGGRRTELPVIKPFDAQALEEHRAVPAPQDDPNAAHLVSSGRTIQDQRIAIVDPNSGRRLDDREVGEIWVSGGNVARGYWARAEETEESFGARLPDDPDAGPFLRTGDLGFLDDQELFVTGRSKDLIIIHGRNIYPHDIELTAERSHPALAATGGAAFAMEMDGEERLVLVLELSRQHRRYELSEVVSAIRAAVLAEFEVPPAAIYLIKPGKAQKTSSGKIMRNAARAGVRDGTLDEVLADVPALGEKRAAPTAGPEDPADDTLTLLRDELAIAVGLGPEDVDPALPVLAFGLDSLAAAGLAHRIEVRLGFDVPLTTFMQDRSLSELTADLDVQRRNLAKRPTRRPSSDTAPEAVTLPWIPLTRGQRALWFQQHLAPDTSAYNVNLTIDLIGPLDRSALRTALAGLASRHGILRLGLATRHEEPVWVPQAQMDRTAPLGLTEVDLGTVDEATALARIEEDAHLPFDMDGGPLARASLYKLGDRHLLTICLHHMICDGWSMNVLFDDLRSLYAGARTGTEADTAATRPYGDFLSLQEAQLAGTRGTRDLAYWRRRLADLPPMLTLPVAKSRPPVQSFDGGSVPLTITEELAARLRRVAADLGATHFAVLLAVFQILLRRYSRTRVFAIGTITSGRTRPGFERTVGYFANPLVVRAEVDDTLPFADLARRVRATLLEALEHQDLPFSALVKQTNPVRDPSAAPLFQVAFGLTDIESGDGNDGSGDLSFSPMILPQQEGQFDLNLEFFRTGGTLHGTFNFARDLFDDATVAHMAEHYLELLTDALARPEAETGSLNMIPPDGRDILAAWSASPPAECPPDLPRDSGLIHRLIADRTALVPDAVAVESADPDRPGDTLTYAELSRRAGLLAARLREAGVGRDAVVAVFLNRSPEMVVAVLATLKAGGAYLPLDATYPREHLATLIEDGAPKVVLCENVLRDRLPENVADQIRVILRSEFPTDGLPPEIPEAADPDSLAYVIFTSGSTGRPKGVMIPHRSAVRRLCWKAAALEVGADDRMLQAIPLSFDPSVWELFTPLIVGARLVLPRSGIQQDPAEMAAVMRRHRATMISCVPSLLAHLCDQPEFRACNRLRHVISGGEPLTGELAERFRSLSPAKLHHFYGPTEATIYATHAICDGGERGRLPIGRPVAGASVHVVDENLRPQPVAVPGELVIGGTGLARGYLDRADLTAAVFAPDPYDSSPGARVYRTGDLVMWRPDGNLQFLERLDSQVKVRGFRIELGAVEGTLRDHPAVQEAVVTVHAPGGGEGSLVAYVVPTKDEVGPGVLRAFLGERLPAYMVPSYVISVESLPLLPNGKVDMAALPEPTGTENAHRPPYVAPSTNMERALVRIWEEILHQPNIGIRDNFLELGGHSLMALRMVTRIREDLGIRVSPMAVMQTPTIETLAVELQRVEDKAHGHLVQIQAGTSGHPVFYVAPGHGDLVSFSVLARRIDPNRPFFALVPPRRPGEDLQVEIGGLAERYVEEMRAALPDGPYVIAGFSLGGVVALEVARQLRDIGSRVAPVILLDTFFPYFPNLSATVFRAVRSIALAIGRPAERWFERPLQQIFTDQGLTAQVEAMRRFEPAWYEGKVVLIMSTTARRLRYFLFRPWRRLIADLTTTDPVTGWHDRMFQDPYINELARIIEPHLDPDISGSGGCGKNS